MADEGGEGLEVRQERQSRPPAHRTLEAVLRLVASWGDKNLDCRVTVCIFLYRIMVLPDWC